MEQDVFEKHTQAFVGVSFHDKIIFNVIEEDGEFMSSGMSIIQHLKHDKNKFISKIIESQSYNSIKYIFDDKIIFSGFYDITNENRESFEDIFTLIKEDNGYDYFYILDLESDTLIVKIPEFEEIYALDYKNSSDVRHIINTLK